MSNYVVDIIDSVPPASTVAWTTVQLGESAARTGPFSTIDTFTLDPIDLDPTLPATRSFHSEAATLPAGWYQLTWLDPSGDQYVTDPIWAGYGLRPSVQEVARLMPDRTTIDGGSEAGTFNSQTTPTDTEVDALIDMVLDSIAPRIEDDADGIIQRAARWVVTLKTATLVETGRFADQRDVNDARVAQWQDLIRENLNIVAGQDSGGSLDEPWVMAGPAPVDTTVFRVDGEIVLP